MQYRNVSITEEENVVSERTKGVLVALGYVGIYVAIGRKKSIKRSVSL